MTNLKYGIFEAKKYKNGTVKSKYPLGKGQYTFKSEAVFKFYAVKTTKMIKINLNKGVDNGGWVNLENGKYKA